MPVSPATLQTGGKPGLQGDGTKVPYAPLYDDVYHAEAGAWAQAQHVFLAGNGLPGRWQGRERFVVLETGFGLGNNFLATWAAWRQDPARCAHLVFVSIEKHPLRRDDLAQVHGLVQGSAPGPSGDPRDAALARRLWDSWPPLTPGLHTLHFDEPELHSGTLPTPAPRVTLLLGLGDVADVLPKLVLAADAIYLDGFAPAKNPAMWDPALLSRLGRLAAPGATAATWSVARGVRDALSAAGFAVERRPGFGSKRDMVQAVHAPRHHAPAPAGGWWPAPADPLDRHAVVVGAGLAGCVTAHSLCRAGWRVTLLDALDGPAQAASGNPGGLFHSIVHAEDGVHARAHRAAALATWRLVAPRVGTGAVQGQLDGLLRLDAKQERSQALDWLTRQHLLEDHVRWLAPVEAQALAGVPVPSGGWHFLQAGWLHPAGLAAQLLAEASAWRFGTPEGPQPALTTRWGVRVDAVRGAATPSGADADARTAYELQLNTGDTLRAGSVVFCPAMGLQPLLDTLPADLAVAPLPLAPVRGQITTIRTPAGAPLPRVPIAGSGYALRLGPDTLLCGATTQHHDPDPDVREADHGHNLQQALRLGALQASDAATITGGRTQWRAVTPDRLPLIGALPWSAARLQTAGGRRTDQVRLIRRERNAHGGLYVVGGLGSRGITWSGLAGELIAHWVAGTPCPVEADLRDALDPARFLVRALSRSGGATSGA
jgi:tRNA 5-methylaminomethyl-2-thiouridine biosynthesis bifunctional protein